jgi:DNA-binding CsgD family transcriptional regulator
VPSVDAAVAYVGLKASEHERPMTSRALDFESLILTIHAASLSDDGWSRIGDEISRALSADSASLVKPSSQPGVAPWIQLYRLDASLMNEYASYWGKHDAWYQGAKRTGRIGTGTVNVDTQLIDYSEFRKSAFYNEYLTRLGIDRMINACVGAPTADGFHGPVAMSFYKEPGRGPFSGQDIENLERLARHLVVAFKNYWSARQLDIADHICRSSIDSVTSSLFALDSNGRVIFVNSSADELVCQGRWLQIVDHALEPAKDVVNRFAVISALNDLRCGLSVHLIITDGRTGAQAILQGGPIPTSARDQLSFGITTAVWLTPVLPSRDAVCDVSTLFALTPAEKRLLGRLIAGDGMGDTAAHLNISVHTARTQLKAVFSKTGLRSQAALINFVGKFGTIRNPSK